MKNQLKRKEEQGIITLLLLIVIAVVLLSYFQVDFRATWDYGVDLFRFLSEKLTTLF